jgi:hypothetical protein
VVEIRDVAEAQDGRALVITFPGKSKQKFGFSISQKFLNLDPDKDMSVTLRYRATGAVPLRIAISAKPGCFPPWVGTALLKLNSDGAWHEITVPRNVRVFRKENPLLNNGEAYLELIVAGDFGEVDCPAELWIDGIRIEQTAAASDPARAEREAREREAMESARKVSPLKGAAVFPVTAITNRRILPASETLPGASAEPVVRASAARGETVSASFVLRAADAPLEVRLEPGSLALDGGTAVLPASALDLRVVKPWWQDGGIDWVEETPATTYNNYALSGLRELIPELLLKDENLVRTDDTTRENFVRITRNGEERFVNVTRKEGTPGNTIREFDVRDAETLQPVKLEPGLNKQFWLNISIPPETPAGTYSGGIEVTSGGTSLGRIPVVVEVYPFTLPARSHRISGIYYRKPSPQFYEDKVWEQFEKEMRNLVAHGVTHPMVGFSFQLGHGLLGVVSPEAPYELTEKVPDLFPGPDLERAMPSFRKILEIMVRAGVATDALFLDALPVKDPKSPEQLALLEKRVQAVMAAAKDAGFKTVYFYGIDEAHGERLKSQLPAWDVIRRAGGRVFVADGQFPGQFADAGRFLDLSVRSGYPTREAAADWHGAGHEVVAYNNPQSGGEQPDTYRRNYGVLLWQYGFDGAMTYIYHNATIQNTKGVPANPAAASWASSWNDFAPNPDLGKQMMMVYPTANGIIDTTQWEGYRTGINDVRYLRALEDALAALPEESRSSGKAVEAQEFLASLAAGDINRDKADPETIRRRAAELTAALAAPAPRAAGE